MKNKPIWVKGLMRTVFIMAMLGTMLGMPACGGENGEKPPGGVSSPNELHNEMLGGLGINTDLGPLEVPENYNPLGKKYGILSPKTELFFAGFSSDNSDFSTESHLLIDGSDGSYGELYAFEDDSWVGAVFKNCIGADVDGDGFDEIVIVFYAEGKQSLELKVIDNVSGTYEGYDKTIVTGITTTPASPGEDKPTYQPSIAKGDLDADGKDEIIVGFSTLYIFDDKDNDYALIESKAYGGVGTIYGDIFVAAGEIDGDPNEEFIVSYRKGAEYADWIGFYSVYDGNLSTPLIEDQQLSTYHATEKQHTFRYAHVVMGDVDGDRLDEIICLGRRLEYEADNVMIIKYDNVTKEFKWLPFFFFAENAPYPSGSYCPSLAVLNYDDDPEKEIWASRYLLDDLKHLDDGDATVLYELDDGSRFHVATGDMDGDGKDDLIYERGKTLTIAGRDALGNYTVKEQWGCEYSNWHILCTANVDNDSLVVRYDDEHEVLFTDPQIIAVMACPPYHEGVGQNVDACSTTFGTSVGTGEEKEKALGFTVGFSIGYSFDTPLLGCTASCIEIKTTFDYAMDWVSSESREVVKYYAYSSGPGEDKVIFTAIPFDVYYYTIISSPNPDNVGTKITVNVPREPQTLSVSRSFYNKNNGDNMDVGSTILQHTIGDVWSYPTVQQKNTLLDGAGYAYGPQTVGEGSGSSAVGIEVTDVTGYGTAMDFDVGVEAEVTAGGVLFGASAGFHYGYAYTLTTQEGMFFEGVVGDIPAASWSANVYQYGLFAYDFQNIFVVNYWVQE